MALLQFVQKKGSVGGSTFQGNAHGTLERARVIPANPQSASQVAVRNRTTSCAKAWRKLSDAQMAQWDALAAQLPGKLTGFQAYMEINALLANLGQPKVAVPPARKDTGVTACTGLTANDTPLITLGGVSSDVAPDFFVIEACAPVDAGIRRPGKKWRHLTVVPGHAAPAADLDITQAYTAQFNTPEVGQRLFVRIAPVAAGLKGLPLSFNTRVVAHGG